MTDCYLTINLDKRKSNGRPTITHTPDTLDFEPSESTHVTLHIELIEKGATFELASLRVKFTGITMDFERLDR